ncbi:hypothetical protein P3G55_12885 [Leptospira sp. 96542]|nr:hypothetical protein [Leptospira sp. 96542]
MVSPVVMNHEDISPENLCRGIFSLNTRRFGTVAEILIKKILKIDKSLDQFHDLYDKGNDKRIEVKFSRALAINDVAISSENIIESILLASDFNRMFRSDQTEVCFFDCNIQQVKKKEFDLLYYGIFFSDLVEIFEIESKDIGSNIFYSDKQHKGNKGEGQFHISNKTIALHRENYFFRSFTYADLLRMLKT